MATFRNSRQRKFVAWLALVAMWLTIGMPVLSQFLPNHSGSPMDLGAWCTGHGLSDHHPGAPAAPVDKCGYCSLFCHSPLVLGHADAVLPPPRLSGPLFSAQTVPSGPLPRLLSADPRGPPSIV
jgi:hypothetical protein